MACVRITISFFPLPSWHETGKLSPLKTRYFLYSTIFLGTFSFSLSLFLNVETNSSELYFSRVICFTRNSLLSHFQKVIVDLDALQMFFIFCKDIIISFIFKSLTLKNSTVISSKWWYHLMLLNESVWTTLRFTNLYQSFTVGALHGLSVDGTLLLEW